jgi:hypothetical protein
MLRSLRPSQPLTRPARRRAGRARAANAADADSAKDANDAAAAAASSNAAAAAAAATPPRFARVVEVPKSGAPGPSGEQPRAAAVPLPSTPPELEGLLLTKDGDLVDARTGKKLPSLGEPSRFDKKVAALRGDFDPPPYRPNTERAPAALVGALLGPFPLDYDFNAVGRPSPGQGAQAFARELARLVHAAAACPGPAPTEGEAGGAGGGRPAGTAFTFAERKGGRFVSVCVTARVRSPELLEKGFAALAADSRVVMRY